MAAATAAMAVATLGSKRCIRRNWPICTCFRQLRGARRTSCCTASELGLAVVETADAVETVEVVETVGVEAEVKAVEAEVKVR